MTDVQLGFIARFPESVANLTCDAVLLLTGWTPPDLILTPVGGVMISCA